jgi:hypothetical protein
VSLFDRPIPNQPTTENTTKYLSDVVKFLRTNKFAADLAACAETNS